MATPNSNYSEILTTTIDNYSSTLADNVMTHNPLLDRIRKRGNNRPFSGGVKILENLMYAENATMKWYTGLEVLDVSSSDILTSAEFDIKQANVNVVVSGLDRMQNASREQMHNLFRARIMNAEITLQNQISDSVFASNTENNGKAIGGLQHLVPDDPTTGTVGNINAATYTWWRSIKVNQSSQSPATESGKTLSAMNSLYIQTVRGNDALDMFVGGTTRFTEYLDSLQANQRFTDDTSASAGFRSLKFWGGAADVFFDSSCNTNRMYGLNTKYIHFRPHTSRNFVRDPEKTSINQDAIVVPLYFAGNMTVSNRSLQGVIIE